MKALLLAGMGLLAAAEAPASAAAQRHVDMARVLAGKGRMMDAAQEYKVALRLEPDSAEARAGLAALGQEPDAAPAGPAATAAQAAAPDAAAGKAKAQLLCREAEALYAQSDLGGARERWQAALLADPGCAAAGQGLRRTEAEAYPVDASRPFDAACRELYDAAMELARKGRDQDACDKLAEALKLNPANEPVLAALERLKPKAREAKRAFDAGEALRRGRQALDEGRPAEARAALEAVPPDDPRRGEADALLARCREAAAPKARGLEAEAASALKAGDGARAAKLYRQALEADPESRAAQRGLDAARRSETAARRKNGEAREYREAMDKGRAALDAQDFEAARAAFARAAVLQPGSAEAKRGLKRAEAKAAALEGDLKDQAAALVKEARGLEGLGALEDALGRAEKALAKDPDNNDAKALVERLRRQLRGDG